MSQSYLLNAIPGALVPAEGAMLSIVPVEADAVGAAIRAGQVRSAVGHADTANIISDMVGAEVPMARVNVPVLQDGDMHFLALYQGPRLPEGSTTLPKGASLQFYALRAASPAGFQARIVEGVRVDGRYFAGAIDWAAVAWE